MRVYHEIRRNEQGFTLIELSIVIIIIGIITATFMSGLLVYLDQSRMQQTRERMEKITEAVNIYLDINGKLPCAAPLTVPIDGSDFAKEVNDGDCEDTALNGTFRDNFFEVRIGAVPVRSLNIPDEYSFDGWNNRFYYAVQERLATAGEYNGLGQIAIVDSNNNLIINSAHFVVFSVGEDGVGAFNRNGSEVSACSGSKLDIENCDKDARFRSTLLFSQSGPNHFDDIIFYQSQTEPGEAVPSGAVMAFNRSSCPQGWSEFTQGRGRSIVGVGSYTNNYILGDGRNWNVNLNYLLGDTGGFASWVQSVDELAAHSHTTNMRRDNLFVWGFGNRGALDTNQSFGDQPHSFTSEPEGNSQPMENRPPYIALLYCRKD